MEKKGMTYSGVFGTKGSTTMKRCGDARDVLFFPEKEVGRGPSPPIPSEELLKHTNIEERPTSLE